MTHATRDKLATFVETGFHVALHLTSFALQDAAYFTPDAWSFRGSFYIFVGDTWNVPANDAEHIAYVRASSAAVKPYVVGNYFNRESLYTLTLKFFEVLLFRKSEMSEAPLKC